MFLAKLFNEQNLFQHFAGWFATVEPPKDKNYNEFLFRASGLCINLIRIDHLTSICLDQFRKQKNELSLKSKRIGFWSPSFVEILVEASSVFSTLRIMQNQIGRLAANWKNPKKQFPSSLNEAFKKEGLAKYKLGRNLESLFTDYWMTSGKELRAYRDIDNHHFSIVESGSIEIFPHEKLFIPLPDPKKGKREQVTFTQQRDVLEYTKNAFIQFHNFVEGIAIEFGFSPRNFNQKATMKQLNILTEDGVRKTFGILIQDTQTLSGLEFGITKQNKSFTRKLLGIEKQ